MAHFRRLLALAVIAAVAMTTACTSARAVPDSPQQSKSSLPSDVTKAMRAATEHAIAMSRSTGAIVGVWAPWSGSWTAAVGTTKTEGGEPVSADMNFRAAASTEAMTCTVLLALVDDGRLKLDDHVSVYLPDVVGLDGITFRQLCQNTSGLAQFAPALQQQFINNPTRPFVPIELITDALGNGRRAEPGAVWAESDAGLMVLGLALQRLTKQSWSQLYDTYVFSRVGMSSSSLPSGVEIPGAHPHGYAFAVDAAGAPVCDVLRDDTELSPSSSWTAGGVVSNINDLGSFAQAFASGSLVSDKSAKKQWQTVALGGEAPTWQSYGLGGIQMGPMRGSAGHVPGFATAMLSEPKSGLTVVVMLNNSTAGASIARSLAMQLASIGSKLDAAEGKAPVIALPWSDQQAADAITASAICQPPAEETPADEPAPDE